MTGILLARELGPGGRGELAAVVLWPTMLYSIGSLGAIDSITFHTAREAAPLRVIVSTGLALALTQGAALIAIGFVLVPVVLSQHEESVVRDCLLFLASIPTSLVALYLASVLNGVHRFTAFNLVRVTVFVGNAAGLIALAVVGELTVTNAVLAYLAAQLLTVLVAAAATLPAAGGLARPDSELARRILAYGWRSQLSSISNLLNEQVDQLVISVFLAPVSLGLYVVAWTMTSLTGLIGYSVVFATLPTVAKAKTAELRREVARRYVSLTFAASLASIVPLVIFTPELIRLVFGGAFVEATDITRILLVASVALGTGRVLTAALKGANRPLDAGLADGVGLVVTAIGLAALLPLIGTLGAAITSVVAYSVAAGISLRRLNLALDTHGAELLVPRGWRSRHNAAA